MSTMQTLKRWMAVAAVAVPATLSASDWPRFRGPNADGISPETGINRDWAAKPPAVLWKTEMGDGGYAGPAVSGGRVFIVDHKGSDDVVRAIDLQTGADAWTYSYADSAKGNYGFARATPAVDAGKVYTLSRLGEVNCLDQKTGKPIWSTNIMKSFKGQMPSWHLSMSPFIDGKKLILCPGGAGASVVALDKDTGRTIWAGGGDDKPGYATPVAATIGGKPQYVVFNGLALTGVDAEKGRLLWRFPWKTSYDVNAATPIVLGDTVFITTGYGRGCALVDVKGGDAAALWESKDLVAHFHSPVHRDGYLYGIGDPGNLVCIDVKARKTVWKQAGFEKGGLVGVDGMIIAVDGGAGQVVLAEMNPVQYVERGRLTPLGGQSWTAPVVADGKLIVRNKHALACLDLK